MTRTYTPSEVHTILARMVTDHDRKQSGKRGYNIYALAQGDGR